jgi:hypothetical protein
MEIAAEVWFWIGPKATGTANFGREHFNPRGFALEYSGFIRDVWRGVTLSH